MNPLSVRHRNISWEDGTSQSATILWVYEVSKWQTVFKMLKCGWYSSKSNEKNKFAKLEDKDYLTKQEGIPQPHDPASQQLEHSSFRRFLGADRCIKEQEPSLLLQINQSFWIIKSKMYVFLFEKQVTTKQYKTLNIKETHKQNKKSHTTFGNQFLSEGTRGH